MLFKRTLVKYDPETQRAYVELRPREDDGGEQVVVALFTYSTKEKLTVHQIEQEVLRKARHMLRMAAAAAE